MHGFLVVGVALLDAEHALQGVGFIDGVSDPRDVADVVFVAFGDFEVDPDPFFVDRIDRVPDDVGVSVTLRVVEVDKELLVGLVIGFVEFGALEEVDGLLVRFLEGAAQAFVLELVVPDEVDLSDLDLLLAVDQEGDVDGLSGAQGVVVDPHVHFGVSETLFRPIVPNEFLVLVDDVIGEFAASFEFEFFEQFLLLAL